MDEQNFQNEQNNMEQNIFEQPTAEQSGMEQNSADNFNDYYQDYTSAYDVQPVVENNQASDNNTLAIVSLVLGIVSIVTGCCGSGFLFGVGGIICAVFANKKNKSGMGKAGMITSIIGLVLSVIATVVIIIFYVAAFAYSY